MDLNIIRLFYNLGLSDSKVPIKYSGNHNNCDPSLAKQIALFNNKTKYLRAVKCRSTYEIKILMLFGRTFSVSQLII